MNRLAAVTHELVIEIGEIPILVRTDSAEFARLLEERYGSYVTAAIPRPAGELGIELGWDQLDVADPEEGVRVRFDRGHWVMERGDLRGEWDAESRRGCVHQAVNPYSLDTVLRIVHSLILAREGGFLVHAASAVRKGRAFLFAGVSGAGKTTISRLAPPDVVLLTDEISYVRQVRIQNSGDGSKNEASLPPDAWNLTSAYEAFGTPFAGELARVGENVRAPVAALYLLAQGTENRTEPVSESDAARELLRHILFFAEDAELVRMLFQSAFDFVSRVPVRRLVFAPDARVWELIG